MQADIDRRSALAGFTPFDYDENALAQADRIGEFLEHHGVKGMKWGVRKAATATSNAAKSGAAKTKAANDRRLAPHEVSVKQRGKRLVAKGGQHLPASNDAITAKTRHRTAKKSGVSALSNKELQELVNRLNLEQQYDRLSPSAVTKGKKAAKNVTKSVKVTSKAVTKIATTAAKAAA